MFRTPALTFLVVLSACGLAPGPADAGPIDAGPDLAVSLHFSSAPLHRLDNVLEVSVAGRDGGAVPGAQVVVSLWMPAHGHGAPAPVLTELGGGAYRAGTVNFTMAGDWQVTATATQGELSGSQALDVAIP
jgi:hypothetical protein